jgi:hypothetical protein
MNTNQLYILIGFYLYINIPLTINILRRNFSLRKKIMYVFFAWLIPFLGYLIIAFNLVEKDFWNKIVNFSSVVLVYVILLSFFMIKFSN